MTGTGSKKTKEQRIAVIGGGISGMVAAFRLAQEHDVTLFEAEPRLGGHARTVLAGKSGNQPVDTGFIVFNHVNYPNLTALFEALDVPVAKSNMSFGASINGGSFEYGLSGPRGLFAQAWRIGDPRYLAMLRDIYRFNTKAVSIAKDPDMTLGELLEHLGTGEWFREYYILPFSGAIWSSPTQGIMDFPAKSLVDFFKNHALLSARGQHQWYTVRGGSIEYVSRLEASMRKLGVDIRLKTQVQNVERDASGAVLKYEGAEKQHFDHVVFATHSDISLALLDDLDEIESRSLAAIRYQPNHAVLHADPRFMPKRKVVWSSWNYTEPAGPRRDHIDLTYWMNSLQPIPKSDPLFVTLNPNQSIKEELIYDAVDFAHPVYDRPALRAQAAIRARNGTRNTWFCGAWMRNGFHEDGFVSALEVVDALIKSPHSRQSAA